MAVFACIGDVHGALGPLTTVVRWLEGRNIDGVLLVGDFATSAGWAASKSGLASCVAEVLTIVRCLRKPILLVPGNHDQPDCPCDENIDRRTVEVAGTTVTGLGGSGPHILGFPYEWRDEEIADLNLGVGELFLTHTPPALTKLDTLLHSGQHVGSQSVRMLATKSRALVCGHVHEAAGIDLVDGCVCYNTGSLGEPFGRTQVGFVSVCDSGVRVEHWQETAEHGWIQTDSWPENSE